MVRLKRKSMNNSATRFFVRWMESSNVEIEEQYRVVSESQRALLDALAGVIGDAKSLTYQIEHGAFVKLSSQEEKGVAIEWKEGGSEESFLQEVRRDVPAPTTELYEVCFPTQLSSESELQYQIRVLEGLDRFVDSLAFATLVAREG
jgi:hypothetical protein